MWEIHCRTKQTGRNLYLFAPVAFAMKVTALHLWSIFTPKSGAIVKVKETVWPSDALLAWRGFIFRADHERMAMDSLTR